MDTNRKKIVGLQVIRGGAALVVMLYHYTSRYNDIIYLKAHSSWPINVSWGCYAVIMFFLISGFLTAYNIVNQESPGRFIKKRINRLYPTFWVALILTFLVTYLFKIGNVSFTDFLFNFTMLPMLFGKEPVDGVYWTQQYEILFYAYIAVILSVRKKWFSILTICFLLSMIVLSNLFNGSNCLFAKIIRVFGIVEYSAVFVLGLITGFLYNKQLKIKFFVPLFLFAVGTFYLEKGLMQFIALLISYILMTYVIFRKKSFLNSCSAINKFFIFIASCSYPLYLIHQKIGYIIIHKILSFYDSEFIILLPMLISVFLAFFIHKYVEENKNLRLFKL